MILVNGVATSGIDARDRGLAYGDGVFRTLRTQGRHPVWWPDQYAKLAHDCAALGIDSPAEPVLRDEIAHVALPDAAMVKIVVTRGVGARGYAASPDEATTRIVLAGPLPAHARGRADVRARWCGLRLAHQPRLAGIKHLNRLENVLARAEWDDADIFEGLLCDADDYVVSGITSNVFWVKDGVICTPDVRACGVAGVTRARLVAAVARTGREVAVMRAPRAAILAADEVMIGNSLIGLRRVARLDDVTWPGRARWTPLLNALLDEETN